VYDFGDHWHHAVVVEDCIVQPRAGFVVQCLAGENACPPEDVGGAPGYAEFLADIADPRHAEHQSYLDWRGGSFDAARFDREAVNRALGC
ncbi:MAG: plasmid pRiA4b ORF-3 family protein, partial [Burkholderiales bacterium]